MRSVVRRIAIVAGEESGDARAAALMRELLAIEPEIEFFGAGGTRMARLATGALDHWIDRAAVVGLWDVLRQYGYFRKKFSQLLEQISVQNPDAVILIDYPGFNLRLAEALRKKHPKCKIIYYISPQVWAWNRRRIPRMAAMLDLMLCIFPFEKELYEASGLRTVFVGHPLIEELTAKPPLPREENLLGFFPGSRDREIHRLFPPLLEAAKIIRKSRPEVRIAVAAARPDQAAWMRERAAEAGVECEVLPGGAHLLMQTATAGLVCSGTASLEAAILGLPYALLYKVAWLTYEVGRRLVTVRHLGMVNILAGRTVVRELLQDRCTASTLADEALALLNAPDIRARLAQELRSVTETLGGEGASRKAAQAVIETLLL